jgi:hypothetical protein
MAAVSQNKRKDSMAAVSQNKRKDSMAQSPVNVSKLLNACEMLFIVN